MRVTEIAKLSGTRCKIYIENEFAFVLYKGELSLYHIREGGELNERDYHRIMREVLPKRAKLRVLNLLKSRDYTTAQLRNKLRQGGYPEEIVADTLEYTQHYRYTDDLRYAVSYVSCYGERKSRRRIEQELGAKGLGRDTIAQAWAKWEEQGGRPDDQAMIRRLLEKRHYDAEKADDREKQRVYAFLARRGFAPEEIQRAMYCENYEKI